MNIKLLASNPISIEDIVKPINTVSKTNYHLVVG